MICGSHNPNPARADANNPESGCLVGRLAAEKAAIEKKHHFHAPAAMISSPATAHTKMASAK
jgi:hypothetical protein